MLLRQSNLLSRVLRVLRLVLTISIVLVLAVELPLVCAGKTQLQKRDATNLTSEQIDAIVQRLAGGATHSWELGTREQTLLELYAPAYSVLSANAYVPPSKNAPTPSAVDTVADIVASILRTHASNSSGTSSVQPQPLFAGDGSAGDPASNGVAALIANWTGKSNATANFGQAATAQMLFLFDRVPRTGDGAISHRTEQVQLWSDNVYMVPPFLAYYGVVTGNRSMILEAYNQVRLYRNYLRDANAGGLWKHVVLGSNNQDSGHWSTGNGWAAAGMLRVLGTIQGSNYNNVFRSQKTDLENWVNEIHKAMFVHLRQDALFNNYADDDNTFADASSAALLAATVYRSALLTKTYTHIPQAEKIRQALWATSSSTSSSSSSTSRATGTITTLPVSSTTTSTSTSASSSTSSPSPNPFQNYNHFSPSGWLTPVVNPNAVGEQGSRSPESEAFVLQMYAAWRDWADSGSPGGGAAASSGSSAICGGRKSALLGVGVGTVTSLLVSSFVGGLWGSGSTDDEVPLRDSVRARAIRCLQER